IRVSDFESLSDWDLDGVDKTFGDNVPGYRSTSSMPSFITLHLSTSHANIGFTAFLTTLRSNLHLSTSSILSPSQPSSAISTPTTPAFSAAALQYPAPSHLSISTSDSLPLNLLPAAMTTTTPLVQDEIPELTYNIAPAEPADDRIEALKLIADSVAQQRQAASKAVIIHPATLSATVALTAIMARFMEVSMLLTTSIGLTMAALLATRFYTSGYLAKAEAINWTWLENTSHTTEPNNSNGNGNGSPTKKSGSKNEDPIVLVSKWGDQIIGALVMRMVKRERKGYVRAWTVKLRYRKKGIGRGLLEEAAKVVWGRGGRMMEFETQHANSHRVLPAFFDGPFENNEMHARNMLSDVVIETKRERSSR
ncbi:MAG: hypothetical protein Q9164_007390, partial [Protoblastenia rupestris]